MKGIAGVTSALAKNSLGLFLRMLATGFGVKLAFGGNPRTDGKTVWLPHLPYRACAELIEMAVGDLIHEAAHVLFTDFDVSIRRVKAVKRGRAQYKALLNAIEDPRIENRVARLYQGARRRLHRSTELAAQAGRIRAADTPLDALLMYINLWGDVHLNAATGWYVSKLAEVENSMQTLWDQETFDRITAELPGFHKLTSTEDACDMAERILQVLIDAADNQDPAADSQDESDAAQDAPQQQGDSGGDGEADGDSGESSCNSGDSGSDGASGGTDISDDGDEGSSDSASTDADSDGAEGTAEASDEEGEGEAPGSSDSESGTEKSASPPAGQQGNGAGSAAAQQALQEDPDNPGSPLADRHGHCQDTAEQAMDQAERGDATTANTEQLQVMPVESRPGEAAVMRERTSGATANLRGQLVSLLARSRAQQLRPAPSGRLRPGRLGMSQAGATPYGRKTESLVRELNVMMLVDLSGSMKGRSAQIAAEATLAVCDACCSGRIPVAVGAFADDDLYPIKGYSETIGEAGDRIATMPSLAGGGTPLGGAIEWCVPLISRREEARKLLLVVTDGQPNHLDHTRAVIAGIRDDVECIGIGIGDHSCGDLFPVSIDVPDLNALPGALMGVLRSRMVRAA